MLPQNYHDFSQLPDTSNEENTKTVAKQIRYVLTADMIYRRHRKWPLIEVDRDQIMKDYFKGEHTYVFEKFSVAKSMMRKHKGKIVIAGGCLFNYHFPHSTNDMDIFFYGITEAEATDILIDCISMFKDLNFTIERKSRVVNVIVEHTIYQFILRIYPTLDSIIGGFDIPLSMFATDGETIWTTPIGHYCITRGVLIADVSRRSTTFEYRLVKYARRFRVPIYFPGLDANALKKTIVYGGKRTLQLTKDHEVFKKLIEILGLNPNDEMHSRCSLNMMKDNSIGDEVKITMHLGNFRDYRAPRCKLPHCYALLPVRRALSKRVQMDGTITKHTLEKVSDYEGKVLRLADIPKINGTLLRCGNIENICITLSFTDGNTVNDIKNAFINIIENPVIEYDTFKRPKSNKITDKIKAYGKYAAETNEHSFFDFDLTTKIKQDVENRLSEATKLYTGIKWLTKNPDRQWTSSYNPVVTDVRKYYPIYNGFTVGIPREIETILRIGFRTKGSLLSLLNKDMFETLLNYVVLQYSFYRTLIPMYCI